MQREAASPLGRCYGPLRVDIDADAERRFSALTGEDAGPVHPLVVVRALAPAVEAVIRDPAVGLLSAPFLHAEQSFRLPPDLDPTGAWRVRAHVADVGRYGAGAACAIETRIDRPDGRDAIVARTILQGAVQGAQACRSALEPLLGRHPSAGRTRQSWLQLDASLVERYAQASGDTNPLHLQPEVARAWGLEEPIVHGLFLLALAADRARRLLGARWGDVEWISCRFSATAPAESRLAIDCFERSASSCTFRVSTDRPVVKFGELTLHAPACGPGDA